MASASPRRVPAEPRLGSRRSPPCPCRAARRSPTPAPSGSTPLAESNGTRESFSSVWLPIAFISDGWWLAVGRPWRSPPRGCCRRRRRRRRWPPPPHRPRPPCRPPCRPPAPSLLPLSLSNASFPLSILAAQGATRGCRRTGRASRTSSETWRSELVVELRAPARLAAQPSFLSSKKSARPSLAAPSVGTRAAWGRDVAVLPSRARAVSAATTSSNPSDPSHLSAVH